MVAAFRILMLAWVALFCAPERSMVSGAIDVVTLAFTNTDTTLSSPQDMPQDVPQDMGANRQERDDTPPDERTSRSSELADDSFEGMDAETPLLTHVGKLPHPPTIEILGLLHATPLRSLAMSGNEKPPRLG